jgi:hypothetical protein
MPTTFGELLFDLVGAGIALAILLALIIGCERTFL